MKNICVFCGAQVEPKITRVIEEIGNEIIIIENVPAGVCRQCGEKEFTPEVVRHLERICKERVGVVAERTIPVAEYSKA
jgi:YgiT-type zinc finger domain-containing protein